MNTLSDSEIRLCERGQEDNRVVIWRIPTDPPPAVLHKLERFLTGNERSQAARFHFWADRNRFITTRAARRKILAKHLDADPIQLLFETNAFGKPRLTLPMNNLHFSISHSGSVALLAIACARRVGVDVEFIRDRNAMEIAMQWFAPEEMRGLAALPEARRNEGFIACWTRKEAFVKAIGKGLTIPLESFSVPVDVDECDTVLAYGDDKTLWHLVAFKPTPGYQAALAYEGAQTVPILLEWDWQEI